LWNGLHWDFDEMGLGFSIEPGAYLSGELGVRAEVNAFIKPGEVIITPEDYQHDLIVV